MPPNFSGSIKKTRIDILSKLSDFAEIVSLEIRSIII
jgi:hypothetical protein